MKRIIALAALTAVLCGCSQVNEAIMNTAAGVNEASEKVQGGADAALSSQTAEESPTEETTFYIDTPEVKLSMNGYTYSADGTVTAPDGTVSVPDQNAAAEQFKADYEKFKQNTSKEAQMREVERIKQQDPSYQQAMKEQQMIDHAKQTEKNLEDIAAASQVMGN